VRVVGRRETCAVPAGLGCFFQGHPALPPGFHMPPLRGWSFATGNIGSLHYGCSSLREAHASVGMTGSSGEWQVPVGMRLFAKRGAQRAPVSF
jgi:hypothetical protein